MKCYLVCLAVLFVCSGCSKFTSAILSGKAHVASSQQLPFRPDALAKVIPLEGGNFVIAGYNTSLDSILLFDFADTLHLLWSSGIATKVDDKDKSDFEPHSARWIGGFDGDWPEWDMFYAANGNLMLPINTKKGSVTTYHALVVDLHTGRMINDVPLDTMLGGEFSTGSDAHNNAYNGFWQQMQLHAHFSPDSTRLLIDRYTLSTSNMSVKLKMFDRGLNLLNQSSWAIPIDTSKELVDGILPDNQGGLTSFIRSRWHLPLAFRALHRSTDGVVSELSQHPTFDEDTTIRFARIALGPGSVAYYGCTIQLSNFNVLAAAVATFDFGTLKASFHKIALPMIIEETMGPLYVSPSDSVVLFSLENIHEGHGYKGGSYIAYKDVSLAAFGLDGYPKWTNYFKKSQTVYYSYTFAPAPNHAVSYWFNDGSAFQRRIFSLKDGHELSNDSDQNLLSMGGLNKNDPESSAFLNDGSFLIFSQMALLGSSHDIWIYKIVE